jgi:hypothetical protein
VAFKNSFSTSRKGTAAFSIAGIKNTSFLRNASLASFGGFYSQKRNTKEKRKMNKLINKYTF